MRMSNVREDARGLVITLPGQVLFATGKSAILPSSRQKLNEVADVLKDQQDRSIVVEGHTELDLRMSAIRSHITSERRHLVHRTGAKAIQAALDGRKKGGTEGRA